MDWSVLVFAGVILYVAWRGESLLRDWLSHKEREAETIKKLQEEIDAVPGDLLMGAMMETEAWARQDRIKVLKELRAERGSWDSVRNCIRGEE